MAKKFNYQQRRRARVTSSVAQAKTTMQKIKTIQLVEVDGIEILKITTENGTKCEISQKSERFRFDRFYDWEEWIMFKKCLKPGDLVRIVCHANRILDSDISFLVDVYYNSKLSENKDVLILSNSQKEIEIKISELDEGKIIMEDGSECNVSVSELNHFLFVSKSVTVCTVGENIRYIRFY